MRSIRGSKKGWHALRRKKDPKRKKYRCYASRKYILECMGFHSYAEYLASDLWKRIREEKLGRYGFCLLCSQKSCQVHHMSYDGETLAGKRHFMLVQLCRDCHLKVEFEGKGKRSLKGANNELFRLAGLTDKGKRWLEWLEHRIRAYDAAKDRIK